MDRGHRGIRLVVDIEKRSILFFDKIPSDSNIETLSACTSRVLKLNVPET